MWSWLNNIWYQAILYHFAFYGLNDAIFHTRMFLKWYFLRNTIIQFQSSFNQSMSSGSGNILFVCNQNSQIQYWTLKQFEDNCFDKFFQKPLFLFITHSLSRHLSSKVLLARQRPVHSLTTFLALVSCNFLSCCKTRPFPRCRNNTLGEKSSFKHVYKYLPTILNLTFGDKGGTGGKQIYDFCWSSWV